MTTKTWFITGVSSGFGKNMTELLLERGDRVFGTVRSLDSLAELARRFPETLRLQHLELTDGGETKRVVDTAFTEAGRIDVVVNNAGYGLFGAAEELSDEQVLHQLGTNLTGSIQVIRAALPHLRKQGGGRVLQISTYGGQAATPGGSLYNASKWGIEGFCDALRGEVAPFNIGVSIVEPGGARTEFRFGSAKLGARLEAYAGTPAAMVHTMLADRTRLPIGDPVKMVRVMIDSVEVNPAPKRIVLGSDSFTAMQRALKERLADVESQRAVAFSTDHQ